jgi:ComF family protein
MAADDCLECRSWPAELTAARYAYVLAPPASDLVHALKYEGWRELAPLMSRAMARVVPRRAEARGSSSRPADRIAVVPVPTTERRLRERGYNQAELLARGVGRALGRPCLPVLRRERATVSQTTLAPSERRENVRGTFSLSSRASRLVPDADVLLVDDVLTTGATAAEAAVTLTRAGAASVTLVTFARALPRVAARAA